MKVPQEIRSQVIGLYIEGRSEDEMTNLIGLSGHLIQNILLDLDSPESQKLITYQLAAKYGKDGKDTKEYSELRQAKKVLVEQGVFAQAAFPFITELAEFSQKTRLRAPAFLPSLSLYHKLGSLSLRKYPDLHKKKSKAITSIKYYTEEVKKLQEKYALLNKGSRKAG